MKGLLCAVVVTFCAVGSLRADQTIRSLQQALKDHGFYYGTVTGDKSSETTAAIRRYQIRNGLQVTGELNEETSRSLKVSSNPLTTASGSKPQAAQANSVRPDAGARLSESSPPASFSPPNRRSQNEAPYPASFYQSARLRVNRSIVAGAQYQLMSRGYYGGRVDGKYGRQTASAVSAFQSSAGLPPTGRLDIRTVGALASSDAEFVYSAAAARVYETWVPVKKFKHGKWIVKWKRYYRPGGGDADDE